MKQWHTELGLQGVNLPRCGRLAEIEPGAGATKPSRIGGRHEHPQSA
jgi:hypothetical protein